MTEHPPRIGRDGPLHECAYCATPIPEKASKCSHCGEWVRKPVGLLLGLAIFVAPVLFAWFTLGRSRSSVARILAFSWLGFSIFLFLFSGSQGIALRQSPGNTRAATLPIPARAQEAREPGPHERAVRAEIAARERASDLLPTGSPKLEVLDFNWASGEFGTPVIRGTVRNNTSRQYSYVQVLINLYDNAGTQVGSTLANVNNLESNGTWRFEAPVLESSATKARVKDVTGF